jgi:hypothetical protein
MPDFCGDGAAFPGTAGTTVRAWHEGQGISRPEYCSSHSMRCPQWEQLNLNFVIGFSSLAGRIIRGNGEIVQLFRMLPWRNKEGRHEPPGDPTFFRVISRLEAQFLLACGSIIRYTRTHVDINTDSGCCIIGFVHLKKLGAGIPTGILQTKIC